MICFARKGWLGSGGVCKRICPEFIFCIKEILEVLKMNEFQNRRHQNILENRQMLNTLGFKVIDYKCEITYI